MQSDFYESRLFCYVSDNVSYSLCDTWAQIFSYLVTKQKATLRNQQYILLTISPQNLTVHTKLHQDNKVVHNH
jgi:hypothetical protein